MSKRRWELAMRTMGIATKISMTAVMTMRNVKVMLTVVQVCPACLLLNLPLSVSPIRAINKVYKNDGVGVDGCGCLIGRGCGGGSGNA